MEPPALMPGPKEFQFIPVPLKGMNVAKDWSQLDSDEAALLVNVDFGRRRGLAVREGTTRFFGLPSAWLTEGCMPHPVVTPLGRKLAVMWDSFGGESYGRYKTLYDQNEGWTTFATGLTAGGTWSGVVFGGKLYYGNGIDAIRVLDLTTLVDSTMVTLSGTVPRGRPVCMFKYRMVVIGGITGTEVFASAVGEPDRWDTASDGDYAYAQVVGSQDGETITGAKEWDQRLKIFRSDGSVFSLDFNANGTASLVRESASVPCVAPDGLIDIDNDILSVGRDGVYSYGQQENFFGGNRAGEVSAPISPLFDAKIPNQQVGFYMKDVTRVAAVQYKGNIIFAGRTNEAEVQNICLVYTPLPDGQSPWVLWRGLSLACFLYDHELDTLFAFSGDASVPWMYQFGPYYHDSGQPIDMLWDTGKVQLDGPLKSLLRWCAVELSMDPGSDTTLTMFRDTETAGKVFSLTKAAASSGARSGEIGRLQFGKYPFGGGTAGGTRDIVNVPDKWIPTLRKARWFRFRFRSTQASHTVELYGMTLTKKARSILAKRYDTAQYTS